ncbi:ABC transporter ATP-binding protein [Chloroflexota bacterium]
MSDIAIRVEGLSKQYRIGKAQPRYRTLRDSLVETGKAPFRRAAHLLRGQAYGAAGLHEALWALKDVSFEVKEGEVLGVIGRNGAGKSTLLKILSRITEPTEGSADLYGRLGSLLEVGTGFHQELTGRENTYLNGAILGMRREEIDRKFDEIVAFSEIEKFIDTPVKHYSSGMYVRLAFSVAAHLEPQILLVDEVLAVGDVAFQKKCLGKMGEVTREGQTVLFISHNMGAISQLCERAILLDRGGIIADDEASPVISAYLRLRQNRFEGATLDTWNTQSRPNLFFRDIQLNGVRLPGEVVVSSKDVVQIQIVGDAKGTFLSNFRAGVHISTQEDVRIMSYGTTWSSLGHVHVDGRVLLTCSIDQLPLVPGRYFVTIGCADDSGRVDWLENVCILCVAADSGTEKRLVPVYKTHGYFLTESTWTLQSD